MATNNWKQVQAQPFSLSGAGAVAGATSLVLKSFAQINGTLLTMTNFGTIGFGTIDPGNGTLEEQISFTGVVQNASGTATLTGVSTVTMVDPYTQTSGLAQTHAGSASFVISNTAGFYNQFVSKNDDAVITGTYQFPNDITTPILGSSYVAPTLQNQVASKGYADAIALAGAPNASTSVQGMVQLATQAQLLAKTATGSTGAKLVPTPDITASTLLSDYVVDTGAANAYVITPSPAVTAYTTGQIFSFKATHINTTASTLNVNGLGTKAITKIDGATALGAGDIANGQIIMVEYNGTAFQMLNPPGTPLLTSSNINQFLTSTDGAAISFGRPFDYQAFTTSGTWTKPTNLSGNEIVLVMAWGGGGGGATSNQSNSGAGGGGGGGCTVAQFIASSLSSTETVTVATAASSATDGGNTTFGSHLTGFGGAGGSGGTANSSGSGGGGTFSKGSEGGVNSGSGAGGGTGGSLVGGAGGSNSGTAGSDSSYGGGGGGGVANSTTCGGGGNSFFGGGGGGGGPAGSAGGTAGGSSVYGGGGGGSGAGTSGTGGSGGTSKIGGAGGAGGNNPANGSAGSAPGGGGGGGAGATSTGGAGGRGECRVWTFL